MSARILRSAAALLTVAALSTSPVAAQTSLSPRGYVTYGSTLFSSSESFEAVTGETSKNGIGGGGTLIGIWRGVFVDGAFSQQKLSGERVFINDGTVYSSVFPSLSRCDPWTLPAAGGFISGGCRRTRSGVSVISCDESADFAEPADNVSDSKTGALMLAGLDFRIIRWLHAGGEFRYRAVKGLLGEGGVSEFFGEDQLGGAAFAVRVSIGR
jgi:hypothetical protein